jgi:hypothetical protein
MLYRKTETRAARSIARLNGKSSRQLRKAYVASQDFSTRLFLTQPLASAMLDVVGANYAVPRGVGWGGGM